MNVEIPSNDDTDCQGYLPLKSPEIANVDFSFLRPLRPTPVFATYWRFAAERQKVFLRRVSGERYPWTNDPVLQTYKFTNAYRASDRVSQYLIRNVIYGLDQSLPEVFFRTLLFKLFNRIETWQLISNHFGNVSFADFKVNHYCSLLTDAMTRGDKVYSAAYIMPSGGPHSEFSRKHEMHLHLLKRMMEKKLFVQICEAKSMAAAFLLLKEWPTIGDFLAYQFVTDINYSEMTNFSEMEFVVPGPGAKDGISKCFADLGGLTEPEVIKFITEAQEECLSAVGVDMPDLWGRRLQLIDCQNLFCEVSKYSRVVHPEIQGVSKRTRIKQRLHPSSNAFVPWYPPKWGINDRIKGRYVPGN